MTQVEYLYPFEVVKVGDTAYKKSFLLGLLENGTCCSCHQNMMSCECGANEGESKKVSDAAIKVMQMRRRFWERYDGDTDDNKAVVDYAKSVIRYHENYVTTEGKN